MVVIIFPDLYHCIMKKKNPQFILIYQCQSCNLDSGFTELDRQVHCYYCGRNSEMKLISKQVLTEEAVANRLKIITDRLFNSLSPAYGRLEEQKNVVAEDVFKSESMKLGNLPELPFKR